MGQMTESSVATTRVVSYARPTFSTALKRKWNVMYAVMLRDMRTRFFDHGLGFIVVVLWPLSHLIILLLIYKFMNRISPYGDNLDIFFATGLVPTLSFIYVSRFMALSLVLHRPMLAFPVVQPSDILFGRALLEALASCIMTFLTFMLLVAFGQNPVPIDMVAATLAFATTLMLAVGTGIWVGVISAIFPLFVTAYTLFTILAYILSGTLFVAAALPAQIAYALSWNPILQCVEWMRTAYFLDYSRQVLNVPYLVGFALGSFFLGLLLERLLRPWVLEN
jgi:capsular polysaccharide transport system permease protein